MSTLRRNAGVLVVVAIAVAGVTLWRRSVDMQHSEIRSIHTAASATYIGAEGCAGCHVQVMESWRQSHHAQAMQPANASTILGHFNNGQFAKDGITSSFYAKEGKYYVRTDGPDGKLNDYPVAYTFGIFPLQQYLVPFPDGRLQSLVLAWDSRSKKEGGQQWFHLYPHQKMPYNDPLHWTGRNQNWNYMCAECHSTNLRKNYDLTKDSYTTTWSEINVSCESCHGPGSNHVAWAQSPRNSDGQTNSAKGLVVQLKSSRGGWQLEEASNGTTHWKGESRTRTELETCAPCHSRRHPITGTFQVGEPFLDAYMPSLLDDGVYFADGQIQEEDYEYGSFVQSKMYHEGVTCSDCHNPHSLALSSKDLNAVCGNCHLLSKFGTAEHHHHKTDSAGALCVNCHMPSRTYMVADTRRDHSFRIPRPDFSIAYGTPNSCNQCHNDKSAKWADEADIDMVRRFSAVKRTSFCRGPRRRPPRLATSGRLADLADRRLCQARYCSRHCSLVDPTIPYSRLSSCCSGQSRRQRRIGTYRCRSSPGGTSGTGAGTTRGTSSERPHSICPHRGSATSRGERARSIAAELASVALDSAVSERIESEMASGERPESHMNLGLLYTQMGRIKDAEVELQTALRLDPGDVPALINLADLYRAQQKEAEAQQLPSKLIGRRSERRRAPARLGSAEGPARTPTGSSCIVSRKRPSYSQVPSAMRMSTVSRCIPTVVVVGKKKIETLDEGHDARPADRDVLMALIMFHRDKGEIFNLAVAYADKLVQLSPGDAQVVALRSSLNQPQRPVVKP